MLKNLTKEEINQKYRENLNKQIKEKNVLKNSSSNKKHLDKDIFFDYNKDLHNKQKRKAQINDLIQSRRENIILKNKYKNEIKHKEDELDKQRIERSIKEIEQEKVLKFIKSKEEKSNLKNIINQKLCKDSNKKQNKLNKINQEIKYLNDMKLILQKEDEQRALLYNNILDKMRLQEKRKDNTEEYYKKHNDYTYNFLNELNSKNTRICSEIKKDKFKNNKESINEANKFNNLNNKNNKLKSNYKLEKINEKMLTNNIYNVNIDNNYTTKNIKSSKRTNLLANEFARNYNLEITEKRNKLQKENNIMLKKQIEEKKRILDLEKK